MTKGEGGAALSEAQRRTLTCALDALVPASDDGRLPAAGELGLAEWVEAWLAPQPAMRAALFAAVRALDELASEAEAGDSSAEGRAVGFAAVASDRRAALLERLAVSQPPLFGLLLFHAYAGYYCRPRVVEALGLEARPPYPEGHAMAESDLDALLAPVRARAGQYRERGLGTIERLKRGDCDDD